jgi:hypothetical protein
MVASGAAAAAPGSEPAAARVRHVERAAGAAGAGRRHGGEVEVGVAAGFAVGCGGMAARGGSGGAVAGATTAAGSAEREDMMRALRIKDSSGTDGDG